MPLATILLALALAVDAGAAPDGGAAVAPPPPPLPAPTEVVAGFVGRTFVDKDLVLPYRLLVPVRYDPRRAYPIVIFLHGAGERGTDNAKPLNDGVIPWARELSHVRPSFVVVPQCPTTGQWVDTPWSTGSYAIARVPISKPLGAVVALLARLRHEFHIDPHRIFVTGLSMGGFGTWDLLMRYPDMFAAAMVVCGGGDPTEAARLKRVPVWAFHGSADDVVPVAGTRAMIKALRAAGGRVRYTEYKGLGHNVWDKAYGNEPALRWLLAQRR
jgi:predicted peptidase